MIDEKYLGCVSSNQLIHGLVIYPPIRTLITDKYPVVLIDSLMIIIDRLIVMDDAEGSNTSPYKLSIISLVVSNINGDAL